ncbi:MAG: thiamine pyrophosphate-dependent enzyme [Spirochaetes bacterium]|nr:thiamine pyrophosphate-dependent enzyme [Spirochaetota bacterium]
MLLIRRFEERILETFLQGKVAGSMFHLCVGQEAVAVGVCAQLAEGDLLTSNHRGHGHMLARGGDPKRMMAEVFGKVTGYCRGKGGSMHIADLSLGHLGANGVVGGGIPIATGAALACSLRASRSIVACFFGDGAVNEGIFHESLNIASIWKLPVIYVCENNLYALSTQMEHTHAVPVHARAAAYGIPGMSVDGMDVMAVRDAAAAAIDRARSGGGPTLLECRTYRFYGHGRGDPSPYRTRAEEEEWKKRCPVAHLRSQSLSQGIVTEEELSRIDAEISGILDEAVRYADTSEYLPREEITTDVYV